MRSPSKFTTFVLLVAALAASACVPAAHGGFAHVILDSAPGSYIGQGQNYDITDNHASAYSPYYQLPNGLPTLETFSVFQSGNVYASLTFSTHMLGIALQPGTYNNVARSPFEGPGQAGLDVTFYDEGSNMLTGSFTITDATYYKDASGVYQVDTFAATFDQISDNGTSHVTGSIVYTAFATVPEPSSIVLCGLAGLIGLGTAAARSRRVA